MLNYFIKKMEEFERENSSTITAPSNKVSIILYIIKSIQDNIYLCKVFLFNF